MSDHVFERPVLNKGGDAIDVTFQFTTAGTSAPTGVAGKGVTSTGITRTGVGTFEVTLTEGWYALHPVGLVVGGAAAAQVGRPSIRSITRSTRKVVIAMVESDAAPIDIESTGVTVYGTFRLTRVG
jgi:hypothetical protein